MKKNRTYIHLSCHFPTTALQNCAHRVMVAVSCVNLKTVLRFVRLLQVLDLLHIFFVLTPHDSYGYCTIILAVSMILAIFCTSSGKHKLSDLGVFSRWIYYFWGKKSGGKYMYVFIFLSTIFCRIYILIFLKFWNWHYIWVFFV